VTRAEGRPFAVEVTEQADAVVVRVAGEIDIVTAPVLQRHLDPALAGDRPLVVIDLAETTFLDARGVAVLVRARTTVTGRGGRLVIRRPPPLVLRVLQLADQLDRMDVEDDAGHE
jgi:anti-anti-sigma factor